MRLRERDSREAARWVSYECLGIHDDAAQGLSLTLGD